MWVEQHDGLLAWRHHQWFCVPLGYRTWPRSRVWESALAVDSSPSVSSVALLDQSNDTASFLLHIVSQSTGSERQGNVNFKVLKQNYCNNLKHVKNSQHSSWDLFHVLLFVFSILLCTHLIVHVSIVMLVLWIQVYADFTFHNYSTCNSLYTFGSCLMTSSKDNAP